MRSICIAQPEGWCRQTTTTANLGAQSCTTGEKGIGNRHGSSANLSVHRGVDIHTIKYSVYNILMNTATTSDVLLPTKIPGLDIIPANIDLSGAEIELVGVIGRRRC